MGRKLFIIRAVDQEMAFVKKAIALVRRASDEGLENLSALDLTEKVRENKKDLCNKD